MSLRLLLFLAGVALHGVSGVYWTGAAFVLARFGPSTGGLRLRRSQLLAATAAVASGAWLWSGRWREWEAWQAKALTLGAIAAMLAVAVQVGIGLSASRRLEGPQDAAARRRLRLIDGTAAILLAIALCAMVLARYL
jgi:hypothetical protein